MLIERVDYSRITRDLTPDWREDRHTGTPGGILSAGGWVHRASCQSGASEDQSGCGLPPDARDGQLPAFPVTFWAQMLRKDPPERPWGADALNSQKEFCL